MHLRSRNVFYFSYSSLANFFGGGLCGKAKTFCQWNKIYILFNILYQGRWFDFSIGGDMTADNRHVFLINIIVRDSLVAAGYGGDVTYTLNISDVWLWKLVLSWRGHATD